MRFKRIFSKLLVTTLILSSMVGIKTEKAYASGQAWAYGYTGYYQTFVAPSSGKYKLEVWGARGGNDSYSSGGNGGYSSGEITIAQGQSLYIYVGGSGVDNANDVPTLGGWNGGGRSGSWSNWGGGGGGATDIRTSLGLGNWNDLTGLNSRIIVAGGGGGADGNGNGDKGGAGGGLESIIGGTGIKSNIATQTSGYSFGAGQDGSLAAAGGGGGWYGGYSGDSSQSNSSGGSGYIGGVQNGQTIAGNQSFSAPGGGTEVGHYNSGYARITQLDIPPTFVISSPMINAQYSPGAIMQLYGNIADPDGTSSYTMTVNYNIDGGSTFNLGNITDTTVSTGVYTSFPLNLSLGNHTLNVWSSDSQGAVGTVQSIPFIIKDSVNPTLTLTKNTTSWTNENITLTAIASDDVGVAKIKTPDGNYVNASTVNYTVSANGTYPFTAYDGAGNSVIQNITVSNIDKGVPTTPTISINKNVLSITGGTDSLSGISATRYQLNGGTWTDYSSQVTLNDGVYTINTKSIDNAGNESSIATTNVTVYEQALQSATTAVSNAENTKIQTDVDSAKTLVNGLPTSADKTSLLNRLTAVQNLINARNAVTKAESTKTQADLDSARILVNALHSGSDKDALSNRLTALQNLINAQNAVSNISNASTQADIDNVKAIVNALPDGADKDALMAIINATQLVLNAEISKSTADIDKARQAVNALPNGADKDALINRLNLITFPTMNVTANTTSWTNGKVILTATANDTGSGMQKIKLPNGNFVYGSTVDYTVYENGTYTFVAYDNIGNTTTKNVVVSNIDRFAPNAPVINNNSNWTNISSVPVTIVGGTDSQSGVNKTEYKLEGATAQNWTTYSGSFNITNEGVTTITARTIDNLGQFSSQTTSYVKIDRTSPYNATIEIQLEP